MTTRKKSPLSGERLQRPDGYIYVWIGDDDPMASMRTQKGYVLEHRLVLARSLGRPLTSKETAHHKNGKRWDNSIENLQLCDGKHAPGQTKECFDCGSQNIVETEGFLQCGKCGSTKIKHSTV